MPRTVKCYRFWESYFKITEVAFSQKIFKLPYPAVEKREEVNYNFWQRKKKKFDLYQQANKLINTLTNFNYQLTIHSIYLSTFHFCHYTPSRHIWTFRICDNFKECHLTTKNLITKKDKMIRFSSDGKYN